MSRGTVWLSLLLGLVLAWALIGITVWSLTADPPKPPPNACPPSDAANPWCVR